MKPMQRLSLLLLAGGADMLMMLFKMRVSVRHPGSGVAQHQSGRPGEYSLHFLSRKGAGDRSPFYASRKTVAVTPAITSAR